jgi:exodeoxyribonuclease VII small subunit
VFHVFHSILITINNTNWKAFVNNMVVVAEQNSIENLSFEGALAELEDIVRKLESGNIPLESAIDLYSRGNFLRSYCEKRLAEAKLRIEQIVVSQDGNIELKPVEINS